MTRDGMGWVEWMEVPWLRDGPWDDGLEGIGCRSCCCCSLMPWTRVEAGREDSVRKGGKAECQKAKWKKAIARNQLPYLLTDPNLAASSHPAIRTEGRGGTASLDLDFSVAGHVPIGAGLRVAEAVQGQRSQQGRNEPVSCPVALTRIFSLDALIRLVCCVYCRVCVWVSEKMVRRSGLSTRETGSPNSGSQVD